MMQWRQLFIAVMLFFLATGSLSAREIQDGDQCIVPAEQTIIGNLFVVCRELIIDGRVEGSLIGAATKAIVNGTVTGDIYLVGGQLDVAGTIGEDVNFAGVVLRVLPNAQLVNDHADLMSATLSTSLAEQTILTGNVVAAGYQMNLIGAVHGEVSFWGSALMIDGQIDGDVDASVGDSTSAGISELPTFLIPFDFNLILTRPGLRVAQSASVGGVLRYTGPTPGEIDALLDTPAVYTPPSQEAEFTPIPLEDSRSRDFNIYFSQVFREFTTLGLIGLVGLLLFPRAVHNPIRYIQTRPLTCLGVGFFTLMVLIPVVVAIFALSAAIVFILSLLRLNDLVFAVGVMLGIFNVGALSVFAIVTGFLARVIVCVAIGRMVINLFANYNNSPRTQLLSLLFGVLIMSMLTSLPTIGVIFYGIAAALGLGATLTILQAQLREVRETPVTNGTPRSIVMEEKRVLQPPVIDNSPKPLGMDNLPADFTFWDD